MTFVFHFHLYNNNEVANIVTTLSKPIQVFLILVEVIMMSIAEKS